MGWDQTRTVSHAGAKHQAVFVLPVLCERQHGDARLPAAHAPFSFKGVIQRIRKIDMERAGRLGVATACAPLSGVAIHEEFRFAFILRAQAGDIVNLTQAGHPVIPTRPSPASFSRFQAAAPHTSSLRAARRE